MFQAGGQELERLPGIMAPDVQPIRARPSTPGINPGAKVPGAEMLPNLTVVPRGGMDTATARSASVTPIGRFAVVLLLFALGVFFLPKGVRGWFVLIILLGALSVNEGAIGEFQKWALGK